jgi:tyrosyl-tRNA synthetase
VPDQDVERFLKLYTFLPMEEINQLAALRGQDINKAKEKLALEVTTLIHGAAEAEKALEAARAAFSGAGGGDTEAIPQTTVARSELDAGIDVLELFSRTELCKSKSEARRLVQQGGARVNETRIEDVEQQIDSSWLTDGELLLRAGKKRYFRVVLEES